MITVNAYDLRAALTKIKPAVTGGSGSLPILSGVRVTPLGHGRLELAGTNLEITVTAEIAMKGRKGKSFILPFGLAYDIASTVKAPAKITRRNPNPTPAPDATISVAPVEDGRDRATLIIGDRTTTFDLLPADEFPRLTANVDRGGIKGTVPPMAKVMFAASRDDARPILTCVSIHDGHAVATDSYRLAISKGLPDLGTEAPDDGLLIPSSAVRLVAKLGGEPVLHWTDDARQVRWTWDNGTTVTARTVDGVYPNWRGLIAKTEAPGHIDFPCATSLVANLRALKRACGSDLTPVRIDTAEAVTSLRIGAHGRTEDRIDVPGAKADIAGPFAFNPVYLASIVDGLEGPGVTLHVDPTQGRPATVTEGDLTRLVMPVRVS